MDPKEALAKWRAENDEGSGYDPDLGNTVEIVVAAYEAEGARIRYRATTSDEITILRFRGETLGIGNANGPWVQVLEQSGADWMALGTEAGETDRAEILQKCGQVVRDQCGARESALMAFGADCLNYGYEHAKVIDDDREEYITAYIAALNGESNE